tara:strand:+ start:1502 stop:1714 length:213 start_codon:yes stop_codon:yes gene_type:complete
MTGVRPMKKKKAEPVVVNNIQNQFRRWIPKANKDGLPTPAVERRMKKLGALDLSKHSDRVKFGYNYLEFV